MAKKKIEESGKKTMSVGDLNSFLSKEVNPLGGLASDGSAMDITEYIKTGVYALDALISAHLKDGGIPGNRVVGIGGESGTGKTFVCLNIVREAQKQGYFVLYLDSEATIDNRLIENFGIDPKMIRIEPVGTVEEVRIYMAKLLKKVEEQKKAKIELPKMLIILDSMGNLASEKEINDAEAGEMKSDMTRAKALKSMFRIIVHKLGIYRIPMVMTNHTYFTQEMYPKEVFSGGTGGIYNASVILMLSKAKLKTGDEDEQDLGQSGIIVTAKAPKNRLAKPKKIKFEIDFNGPANPYKGLTFWCTKANFDTVGIAKGKKTLVVDEETGEETVTITESGFLWYVKHLDKHIPESQLYTSKVFTSEVLDALDVIAQDYFKYKTLTELKELEARLEALDDAVEGGEDILLSDDVDAADLFS